jgi:hypothetical protein
MESKFKPLDEDVAVSVHSSMFKSKELLAFALEAFRGEGLSCMGRIIWDRGRGRLPIDKPANFRTAWFEEGLDSEILEPSSGNWQKGKVRLKVTIEFYADESKNSLDELNDPIIDKLRKIESEL